MEDPIKRIAAKICVHMLDELLDPDGSHKMAVVRGAGGFHPNDMKAIRKRLGVLRERFNRDADLPDRVAEWYDALMFDDAS